MDENLDSLFLSRYNVREPWCKHSRQTQPMNACVECRGSAEYRAWVDYWATKRDKS